MTHVNVIGLLLFVLYLAVSGAYIFFRCRDSLDGLGELLAYGVVVLVAEMLSVLSLIFYGIWLCAKTDQGDVRAVDAESSDLRRLYVIRVFILCKDETLATVRRTISSVKNAYPTEGCERKLYLLDESKDDAKRDYFMGPKSGTDVIYIAPPVRPEGTKVRPRAACARVAVTVPGRLDFTSARRCAEDELALGDHELHALAHLPRRRRGGLQEHLDQRAYVRAGR